MENVPMNVSLVNECVAQLSRKDRKGNRIVLSTEDIDRVIATLLTLRDLLSKDCK